MRDFANPSGSYSLRLPTEDEAAEARDLFASSHHLRLREFFDPELLAHVTGEIEEAAFYERAHGHFSTESCMQPNALLSFLVFLMHDPRLLRTLESLTGIDGLRSFEGRVYRMDPQEEHHDSWHDDVGSGHLLAISANFGREPFSGGSLELRPLGQIEASHVVSNTVPGDAVVFRIDSSLQHRVLPVTGKVPRTALAGWFGSDPVFLSPSA
jgi:hypothetical protein